MSGPLEPPNLHIFTIPFLPPTSNHIYKNKRGGGGRFLTPLAEQFKLAVKTHLADKYLHTIMSLNPDGIYYVFFKFFMERDDVFNKGFGKKRGAKSKYNRLDISNRIKLIEDAFKDAIGIDDCQFFLIKAGKYVSPNPRVEIQFAELPESDFIYIR